MPYSYPAYRDIRLRSISLAFLKRELVILSRVGVCQPIINGKAYVNITYTLIAENTNTNTNFANGFIRFILISRK
jgi:hypothetical protein